MQEFEPTPKKYLEELREELFEADQKARKDYFDFFEITPEEAKEKSNDDEEMKTRIALGNAVGQMAVKEILEEEIEKGNMENAGVMDDEEFREWRQLYERETIIDQVVFDENGQAQPGMHDIYIVNS